MDITSYLLGKQSSGGGGGSDYNATIIPFNSNYHKITNFITEISDIDTSTMTSFQDFFRDCITLKEIPKNLDTSNGTNFSSMFNCCAEIETIPQLNTNKATDFRSMFYGCNKLKNIPILDTSKVTMMVDFIAYGTKVLTDESINNILQMCINATAYTQTKTLKYLGFTSANYPVSRIEALPKYQDFIDAGWTIGY